MLAFALNAVAHVVHRHDAAPTTSAHSLACGYCLSFDSLIDAPGEGTTPPAVAAVTAYAAPAIHTAPVSRPQTSAHPRAPPR
jgi:alkylhydroperoxidase family enzyme